MHCLYILFLEILHVIGSFDRYHMPQYPSAGSTTLRYLRSSVLRRTGMHAMPIPVHTDCTQ
jgi:hypothetical protein